MSVSSARLAVRAKVALLTNANANNASSSANSPGASTAAVFLATRPSSRPRRLQPNSEALLSTGQHQRRSFTAASPRLSRDGQDDPRVRDIIGREIQDDYAHIREHYATPKYPIVLAHGLLGFSVLRTHPLLPPIQYWHGITSALQQFLGPNSSGGFDSDPTSPSAVKLITPTVPPSGTIQQRAEALAAAITAELASTPSSPSPSSLSPSSSAPQPINIIAHSMGGLDARYMISRLLQPNTNTTATPPPTFRVASLVTVATPHLGSPFADYMLDKAGLESWYGLIGAAGLGTGAFRQLTTAYARHEFNPSVPDADGTRYFSFGASLTPAGGGGVRGGTSLDGSGGVDRNIDPNPTAGPGLLSPFRVSWSVIDAAEGPNDGLVSVESSRWGEYRGTLAGVNHLDLINWSNRAKWEAMRLWTGRGRSFNAVAFYLDIADMLAREGY